MRITAFLLLCALFAQSAKSQDWGLYWKYKDYDGSVAVSVPRWATFVGAAFVDEKEDRKIVRKIHKVRVLFFEDASPFSERDMKKFARKAKRRHLDELVTVRTGKTHVKVMVKERRNAIRKAVVLFSSPDDGAGLVTIKGKFKLDEINRAIQKADQKSKKKDKEPVLPNIKVPVIRA
jgi:hypothetical protein